MVVAYPIRIDRVQRYANSYRFAVKFEYQYRYITFATCTYLTPPCGLQPIAFFIELTLYRVVGYLQIAKITLLILIQIALRLKVYTFLYKKVIKYTYNVSLKLSAFVSGINLGHQLACASFLIRLSIFIL